VLAHSKNPAKSPVNSLKITTNPVNRNATITYREKTIYLKAPINYPPFVNLEVVGKINVAVPVKSDKPSEISILILNPLFRRLYT
jgi:hypothetical protein